MALTPLAFGTSLFDPMFPFGRGRGGEMDLGFTFPSLSAIAPAASSAHPLVRPPAPLLLDMGSRTSPRHAVPAAACAQPFQQDARAAARGALSARAREERF
jgi:hypothetical protein